MAEKSEKTIAKKDPFSEKVERMYPLDRKEGTHIYAEVNGKGYQVQRGVTVKLPKPIAEVIDNMFKMQFVEDEYINANKEE